MSSCQRVAKHFIELTMIDVLLCVLQGPCTTIGVLLWMLYPNQIYGICLFITGFLLLLAVLLIHVGLNDNNRLTVPIAALWAHMVLVSLLVTWVLLWISRKHSSNSLFAFTLILACVGSLSFQNDTAREILICLTTLVIAFPYLLWASVGITTTNFLSSIICALFFLLLLLVAFCTYRHKQPGAYFLVYILHAFSIVAGTVLMILTGLSPILLVATLFQPFCFALGMFFRDAWDRANQLASEGLHQQQQPNDL